MQNDVEFRLNSGDDKGKVYRFTLAVIDGKKAWARNPVFHPAPSMIKEKIDMVIRASEDNIPRSGARELKAVNKILEQLTAIATETTPPTLTGLDKQSRYILIDEDGFSVNSFAAETKREPEYTVGLTCWGLYDY